MTSLIFFFAAILWDDLDHFFNSCYMNNCIAYRGAVIWNLLSPVANGRGIKAFIKKAWQSTELKLFSRVAFCHATNRLIFCLLLIYTDRGGAGGKGVEYELNRLGGGGKGW